MIHLTERILFFFPDCPAILSILPAPTPHHLRFSACQILISVRPTEAGSTPVPVYQVRKSTFYELDSHKNYTQRAGYRIFLVNLSRSKPQENLSQQALSLPEKWRERLHKKGHLLDKKSCTNSNIITMDSTYFGSTPKLLPE